MVKEFRKWINRKRRSRIWTVFAFLAVPFWIVIGPIWSDFVARLLNMTIATSSGIYMAVATITSYILALAAIIAAFKLGELLRPESDVEFAREYLREQIEAIRPTLDLLRDNTNPSEIEFKRIEGWASKTKKGINFCTNSSNGALGDNVSTYFLNGFRQGNDYTRSKEQLNQTVNSLKHIIDYRLNHQTVVARIDRNIMDEYRGL